MIGFKTQNILKVVSPIIFFRLLQTIDAPMSLRKFPSGACVLQLNSHRDEEVAKTTSELVILLFIGFCISNKHSLDTN